MNLRNIILLALAFPMMAMAQNYETQTYTLDKPYEVKPLKAPKGKKVKNVVLMIGDGMSLMHIQAASTVNRGRLWLMNATHTGLSITPCTNRLITDSGAGGTALATGVATTYHSVGVDAQGKPVPSLIDYAKAAGKGAGVAVTCRLWDATPSDFLSHNIDRENKQELVGLLPESPVDYVFGGGAKYFTQRKDGRNIFRELEQKGYKVLRSVDDLWNYEGQQKVYAVPFDVDTPLPDERGDMLARATLKGMNLLNQNKKGFFMMVEGSQLDDYAHFNQLDMLMKETLDFDRTIGAVMQWAEKDGETLVVVTADHETGGMTVLGGDWHKGTVTVSFSTKSHSGTMVPVYAFGPGAEEFTGFMKNTEICEKIRKLMKM